MEKRERRMAREKSVEFEKEYFNNLINGWLSWEVDDNDLECFFEDVEWMKFPVRFANDSCVILDAGAMNVYIEWGISECPVYVDVDGEYQRIGRVRNSRFWAIADRVKKN